MVPTFTKIQVLVRDTDVGTDGEVVIDHVGHIRCKFHDFEFGEHVAIGGGLVFVIHAHAGNPVCANTEPPFGIDGRGNPHRGNDRGLHLALRRRRPSRIFHRAFDFGRKHRCAEYEFRPRAVSPEAHAGRIVKNGAEGILRRGNTRAAHGARSRADTDEVGAVGGPRRCGDGKCHYQNKDVF